MDRNKKPVNQGIQFFLLAIILVLITACNKQNIVSIYIPEHNGKIDFAVQELKTALSDRNIQTDIVSEKKQ